MSVVTDGATSDLLKSGRAGTSDDAGDHWREFTDEEDLRCLLRNILPAITDGGALYLDDHIEDTLFYAEQETPTAA